MNNLFIMYCHYKYIRKEMIKYINFSIVVYHYVCVVYCHVLYAIAFFYSHVISYSTYVVRNCQKLYLLFLFYFLKHLLEAHA